MSVIDIEKFAKDGRLTEPSDRKRYRWCEMINESKAIGRPLTKAEVERFIIK